MNRTIENLALALVYLAAGKLSTLLIVSPGFVAPVWPAAGLAFSALFIFGARLWPGVLLGAMLVVLSDPSIDISGGLLLGSAGAGLGATLQALLGSSLVRRAVGSQPRLDNAREILVFLFLSGPLACLVNSTMGPLMLLAAGIISVDQLWQQAWTWWVSDVVGVVLIGPIAVALTAEPLALRRLRRRALTFPLIATTSLVLVVFLQTHRRDIDQRQLELDQRTAAIARTVNAELTRAVEVVQSVQSLFAASEVVTREEFRRFTRLPLSRATTIRALSWVPHIPQAERSEFERNINDEGVFSDFQVLERLDGQLVPASVRATYVPVSYIEPVDGNRAALGFDLLSDPARQLAVNLARDTGQPVATGALSLVQETGHQVGFLVLVPVYRSGSTADTTPSRRASVQGYAAGVFRVGDLIERSLKAVHHQGIEFEIFDEHPAGSTLLFSNVGSAPAELSDMESEAEILFASRRWTLRFSAAHPTGRLSGGWLVLVWGLLFVVMISGVLLLESGRVARVGRLVELRTLELKTARDEALAAVKTKSRFMANMSHEIRSPLNGVLGMTALLIRAELGPQQREMVETIQRSGRSLLTIINDILDLSKLEAEGLELTKRPFNPRYCVVEALDLFAAQAEDSGLDLSASVDASLPELVVTDEHRLRQVLINLIGNALKFTESGEVSVELRPEGARLISVEVHDTGVGIPAEAQDLLFRPFSQVDVSDRRAFAGTGLGLAISKRLVGLLGGDIGVRSTAGGGSTFWFTFEHGSQIPPTEPDSRGALSEHRVFLVEARPATGRVLRQTLAAAGAQFVVAERLEEVVAAARRGEQVDAVIYSSEVSASPLRELAEHAVPRILLASSARRLEEPELVGLSTALLRWPLRQNHLVRALLDPQPQELNAPPPPSRRLAAQVPQRILVAEDNPTNQAVIVAMLKSFGYTPTLRSDGAGVLEALDNEAFDLVLMDIQMPGMDGVETTRRVRAREDLVPQPRIIALTANVLRDQQQVYQAVGMDGFLAKPIELKRLEAVLEGEQGWQDAAGSVVGGSGLIDQQRLLSLLAVVGGQAPLRELLDSHFGNAWELIKELGQSMANGDSTEIHRAAHSLKSSSAMFGNRRVSELCRELEDLSESGAPIESLRGRIQELHDAMKTSEPLLLEAVEQLGSQDAEEP